jgi:hypothetical protein
MVLLPLPHNALQVADPVLLLRLHVVCVCVLRVVCVCVCVFVVSRFALKWCRTWDRLHVVCVCVLRVVFVYVVSLLNGAVPGKRCSYNTI